MLTVVVCFIYMNKHVYTTNRTAKDREKQYINEVNQKQAQVKRLQARYDSIRMRMYNDSLVFVARLNASNEQIKRLKRNAEKVDFKTANPAELDSMVNRLYPSPRR